MGLFLILGGQYATQNIPEQLPLAYFQQDGLLAALTDLTDNWLALHRVELRVQVDHAPAIHLYEKFGFTIEGTARDAVIRDGAYIDVYSMARLQRREVPG